MEYLVKITPRAERDLSHLYEAINAEQFEAVLECYLDLKNAILSLRIEPNRCPQAPERDGLRHLLYGHKPHIYRVIYRVIKKQKYIEVLHTRHGARQKLNASDLS